MNKFKVVTESKDPKILVVTPLLPGHKISKETKKTIKRNDVPYTWITSEGNNNIPTNLKLGLEWFNPLPPFYFMLDNDIILGRGILDRLVRKLEKEPYFVAFTYASFQFKGTVNQAFPAMPYNIERLLQHNYISSNSLFRSDVVMKIGLVTEQYLERLLDWAMILKLYYHGYIGMPTPEANFIAVSTPKDISARSSDDYNIKRFRVLKKYGEPIINDMKRVADQSADNVLRVLDT